MKKIIPLLLASFLFITDSQSQTRYLVKLKNKGGASYTFANPSAYLSQRAIDRRLRYNIAIDSTDLPVTPSYVAQIAAVPNVTVLNASKWLNSVSIQTTDPNAITTISNFSFVQNVSGLAARNANNEIAFDKFENDEKELEFSSAQRPQEIASDFYNYGINSFNEIKLHQGQFLHNIGLRGQGMNMALLDAGFTNYTALRAFDSINANNQVFDTWDFVSRHANVHDHSHGMQCLSTIAANIPGQFVGKAPKASFYLYRTEDAPTEYPIEEHNWACGAERADSIGADVISTSLGYTDFQAPLTGSSHTYADMNGNTTMAAIAADLAAKKGIMVFASAGNEGNSGWHFLVTPSDGDSVVCVGAVDTLGNVATFSSYGPSSDGQVKPDMASIGFNAIVQGTTNNIVTNNGTSFACPNMAGLGTCLWQGFPEFNNMKIIRAMQQAGNRATNPNDRIGYGIPDMKKAFSNLLIEYATSSASVNNCSVTLNWNSKDIAAMKYEIERKAPGDTGYMKIGEINSQAGDVLTNRSYQFNNSVAGISAGTISYRIRQIIDADAATFTAIYIDTANVSLPADCPGTDGVRVVPNPASGQVNLEVITGYAVPDMPVRIFDAGGRLMQTLKFSKGIGQATFNLPMDRFAKGTYYIAVYNGDKLIGTTGLIKL